MGGSGTASVAEWLLDGARSAESAEDVLSELCERLTACGIPLWRVSIFVHTLHPDIIGQQFRWIEGQGVQAMEAPFAMRLEEDFQQSPVLRIQADRQPMRRRLGDPGCVIDFGVLAEFRAQGATDYFAVPLFFTNGEIHVATFLTRQPGGFGEAAIAGLEAIVLPLTRVTEVRALQRLAVNLLDAYVGHEAGGRILSGRIQRGEVESIRAVLWLSDMRGFSALSDRLPAADLMGLLNRFFDAQVPAITGHGGEVLKFMGDGLLAVFRVTEETAVAATCARALKAAGQADAALGEAGIRFGLGLHLGEMLYGNIGGGGRLDFTCIGPAVNLVARLEKLAGQLGRRIVCSSGFARHVPAGLAGLGDFELPGFREAEPVFGIASERQA